MRVGGQRRRAWLEIPVPGRTTTHEIVQLLLDHSAVATGTYSVAESVLDSWIVFDVQFSYLKGKGLS